MADSKELVPGNTGTHLPQVSATVQIDKKDVVDVAMAKIEAQIQSEESRIEKEILATENGIKKAQREFNDEIQRITTPEVSKVIKAFNSAFNLCVEPDRSRSIETMRPVKTVTVEFNQDSEDKKPENVFITVSLSGKPVFTQKNTVPQRGLELHSHLKGLTEKLTEQKEDLVGWKRKRQMMPMIERQMKARVVENELSKSAEGKQLLASMIVGDIKKTIDDILNF